MEKLIMFHGKECSHCKIMMPLVRDIEEELELKFNKKEIWHNEKNKKEFIFLKEIANTYCKGLFIPAFYNSKTKKMICGEISKDKLKKWIKKPIK